uniref:NADH-ubiquinone oxidoreductase chain 4L n=1 Tax=Metaurus sp. 1 YLZ-2024a TaxID=3230283 RepID=A0AAU8G9T8_9HEMI
MVMYLFCYFFSIINLILVRSHFLMCLLALEFMVLILFFFLYYFFYYFLFDLFFLIIFLVFSVCEGVIGLSLLVFLIRSVGNDYLTNNFMC